MKCFSKYIIIFVAVFLGSLFTIQAQKKPVNIKVAVKPLPPLEATYENGIKMRLKGFIVKKAFLEFDNGRKVPPDNKIELNQQIGLVVVIEGGWLLIDGKAYPGGSENIKLDNGYEILNTSDLFAAYSVHGVGAKEARYISMKASITSIKNKHSFVIVNFRIWDKKSGNEILGNYKFSIK